MKQANKIMLKLIEFKIFVLSFPSYLLAALEHDKKLQVFIN